MLKLITAAFTFDGLALCVLTQTFLRASQDPICRGAHETMLKECNWSGTILCYSAGVYMLSMWYPVHFQNVSIFSNNFVNFRGVSMVGNELRLKQSIFQFERYFLNGFLITLTVVASKSSSFNPVSGFTSSHLSFTLTRKTEDAHS